MINFFKTEKNAQRAILTAWGTNNQSFKVKTVNDGYKIFYIDFFGVLAEVKNENLAIKLNLGKNHFKTQDAAVDFALDILNNWRNPSKYSNFFTDLPKQELRVYPNHLGTYSIFKIDAYKNWVKLEDDDFLMFERGKKWNFEQKILKQMYEEKMKTLTTENQRVKLFFMFKEHWNNRYREELLFGSN